MQMLSRSTAKRQALGRFATCIIVTTSHAVMFGTSASGTSVLMPVKHEAPTAFATARMCLRPKTPFSQARSFSTNVSSKFTAISEGAAETRRVYFFPAGTVSASDKSKALSPWHDIPLFHTDKIFYNFVNEIPKGTVAKMEIATKEEHNPIKQDSKDGKLRVIKYGKFPFNYGAIPQTWENPNEKHEATGLQGDNDPIDVVELSPGPLSEGGVIPLKVLGALALIDEGELDWKIIGINAESPMAELLNKADDIENVLPQAESTIREWFRNYKTADGKPQNKFAFEERIVSKEKAVEAIEETHEAWKALVSGAAPQGKLWVKPLE